MSPVSTQLGHIVPYYSSRDDQYRTMFGPVHQHDSWFPEGTRLVVIRDPGTGIWCIEWHTPNLGRGVLRFATLIGMEHAQVFQVVNRIVSSARPVDQL